MKPIIGLVGGIGSGKSVVARLLQAEGAAMIDADDLNHQQLRSVNVINTLRQWWGDDILLPDGTLDRKKIAKRVFSSPDELKKLENLTHPLILAERDKLIKAYESNPHVWGIVWDAPLLIESGHYHDCVIVFVETDSLIRLQRVKERGWSEEEWQNRERCQVSLSRKHRLADYTIENNDGIDELRRNVRAFVEWLKS